MQKLKASKLMQVQGDGKIKKDNDIITPEEKNKEDINKISKVNFKEPDTI